VFELLSEFQADEEFANQQIYNNELLSYFLRSMKDDRINILNYWKGNVIAYRTLVMMARYIFTVFVSIISFKLYFSSAH
jgi:lipid-A-disaccharide synthase-like uncharacterized protein